MAEELADSLGAGVHELGGGEEGADYEVGLEEEGEAEEDGVEGHGD